MDEGKRRIQGNSKSGAQAKMVGGDVISWMGRLVEEQAWGCHQEPAIVSLGCPVDIQAGMLSGQLDKWMQDSWEK